MFIAMIIENKAPVVIAYGSHEESIAFPLFGSQYKTHASYGDFIDCVEEMVPDAGRSYSFKLREDGLQLKKGATIYISWGC